MEREEILARYHSWRENAREDEALAAELATLDEGRDYADLEDRFYQDLKFGTGGLRGVLGAGSNRMNIYTVRKATQGLANWLGKGPGEKKVAIAYDSRINSDRFALEAALVLAGNGVTALLYPRLMPTPALSFAVRQLGCQAGICVTASHNPAKYNGYKVYGPDGGQITDEAAGAIQSEINGVDVFTGVVRADEPRANAQGLLQSIGEDTVDAFLDAVAACAVRKDFKAPLRVVYSPLNGTGRECVLRSLADLGVEAVVVPQQENPDGNFPTCPYPNPEIPEAMALGLELSRREKPDLLLATDPDCDRVGVAVPEAGDYRLLTGNEVGVLLLHYICRARKDTGTMPAAPVAVKTIVTTDMADAVARAYGVELREVLTGFKYIGEQITELAEKGEEGRYIFGFEESCGYLSGAHVRDKDGVNAARLICEAARWYKDQGKNLGEVMEALYREYGYYGNRLLNFEFPGAAGAQDMKNLMEGLRAKAPEALGGLPVEGRFDYLTGVAREGGREIKLSLPASDVLAYKLAGGCKATVRPSGTEPKMKIYLSAREESPEAAQALLDKLEADCRALLG